jgi:hypothetical protein
MPRLLKLVCYLVKTSNGARGKCKANDTTQKQIQAGNDTRVEAAGTHAHVCKCCNTERLLDSKRTPCEKHSSTHRPRNECYLTK